MLSRSSGRPFSFYLKTSTFFHVLLVVICIVIGKISFDKMTARKDYNLKLIEQSVRVDVVAMPKYTLKELKSLSAGSNAPEVIDIKSRPSDANIKSDVEFQKKSKKKNFADMLKNLSAKKVKKSKKSKKAKKSPARNIKRGVISGQGKKQIDKLLNYGNKLSSGTALYGSGSNVDAKELSEYQQKLLLKVKPLWKLPSYLKDLELQCRIKALIDSKGRLLRAEVLESSGNTEYDDKALQSIKRASPFPVPKGDLRVMGINQGFVFGFPL